MRSLKLLILTAVITLTGCIRPEGEPLRVRVAPGATFSQVTDSLAARGIIPERKLFRLYARVRGGEASVQPGTYGFRKGEAWEKILTDLREGNILTARLVIPEAFSLDKIAARIAAITLADSATVLAFMTDTSVADRFRVPGPTLEGYLYPATYRIGVDLPLDTVLKTLVNRYRQVWTPERKARADSMGMSEREVIALASIVEKEAKRREEMPTIASVYHNRLRIGMKLDADPTVQYALGNHRARLLYRDIDSVTDHPYNTYRNRGLPPGPIGNPSTMGIDAVLNPADTKYLYFVARSDGSHVFTTSLTEHNRAKAAVARERRLAASSAAQKPAQQQ